MPPATGQEIDRDLAAFADTEVAPFLDDLARLHVRLCPRQVLGARMALLAGRTLDVPLPQADKRVVMVAELDGCFVDGLYVPSGCSVGHRTMRVVEFGKIAVTVIDTRTRRAERIRPRRGIRDGARAYAPGAADRWHAQRLGYARMPVDELLEWVDVPVPETAEPLLGPWSTRTTCARCGEEVLNDRHVSVDGLNVCRACAGLLA